MANSGSISPLWGALTRFISVDCCEFSLHLVSNLSPRCLPISVFFFSTLSLHPPKPDSFCFYHLQLHPPSTVSILFLLPREVHMFPIELFLLLTFSGAVEYSMIIFYFIANIMKGGYIMLIFLGLVYLPQDEFFFYSSIHLPENSWYHCFSQLSNTPLHKCTIFFCSFFRWGKSMLFSFWVMNKAATDIVEQVSLWYDGVYFIYFLIIFIELYIFLSSPVYLSPPLQPSPKVPMLPIYSGDLIYFYFPCRLDLCVFLLESSLLSRFSGLLFVGCFSLFYV